RDRFRRTGSALCALDPWTRFVVELGQFGHGRLPREARAMAAGDRWLPGFVLSGPRGRGRRFVIQYRVVGPAVSQCTRWGGLRVRTDDATLDLARGRPFAAHGGAGPLS